MESMKKWISERTTKKNGLYVHYSPPKLLDVVSAAQFRQWARDGAGTKLERAVLAGQGRRLLAEAEALPLSHHLPALVAKCDALHGAVEKGSLLELKELLEADYNRRKFVTCRDEAGVGLLHKAVYYEYFDIASWLVSNYPQLVNERDSAGRTPLHYAVACRDEARMAALLEGAGAARGARDAAGRTPAHYRAARTLLTLPTPPDMPPEQTRNPPGLVIKRHNIRIWFHDCDMARLQRVVWDGHGARLLSEVSNQPVVKRFLEALPYIMNTIREIHNAVAQNDLEGLIKHAGEPVPAQILSSRDPNNLTVMHKAAGLGEGGIIRYITDRYPQGINDVDNDGRTPLHYAATVRDDQHMYNTLVSLGADEGVVDNKNRTPAYYFNRPQEIDKNIFKVLPEAPRTPTSAYPANWDWKILDTEAIVELNKKSRRKNLKASNENISSKNNSNSISENTHSRRGGMKTSSTHDMIKNLPDLNESSKNHNGNVEVNKDSELAEDTDAKNEIEAEKGDNEEQKDDNEEQKDQNEEQKDQNEKQTDEKEDNQDENKEPVEETTDHPEVSESTENFDEFHDEEESKDIVEENKSNHGDGTKDGDVANVNEEVEPIDNSEEENENKQISDTEENSQKEDVHDNKESNIEENNKADLQATNDDENENEDITNQSDHDQDENIEKCQDEDNETVNHEEESGKEDINDKHDENTSHDNDSNKSEEEGDPPIEGNNNHNEDDDDVQVQGDITHSEYSDTHHQNTAEVIDTTSAKRGSEIDGRNTQESLIEGIINSEAEQDSQDASITQRDDTVHGEILVIDSEIDPEVTELINTANMEMLATLVLNGEGSRLVGRRSGNVELQAFLDNVPTYMQKINRVHLAAREGNIRDLQSALDRRKFAIARDPISPNGATPLHVAAVFGKTNIMKYLGGRFPETLSAVDFEGRTALHYAAVLPDNGHYYNLLQQLGANSKDLDDNGRSAEDYNKDPSLLPFSQLIADYGISEEAAQDMLSDKGSSNADGHMDIPAFKTDEGRYLAKSLGDPLIKGLTEVANVKPKDPVAFLASFLHNFPEHEKPQLGTQESNTIVTKERAEVENELPPPAELVPQPLQVSKLTRSAARTATRPQKPIDVVTVDPQPEASSDGPESAFSSANRDEHGQSMLHFAAARHHTNNAVFQLIQESDISIAYRDELYRTARDVSIQANVPENTMDIDKWVLHLAARGNTEKIMQLLLEGYDHIIDLVDEEGVTIVDIVVQRGETQMSNLLASIPAFEDSREALQGAVRRGDLAAVQESISAEGGRTLARSQNSFGRTALHVAVLAQHEDIVAYLVQTCPELLRIGDNLERTPLHYSMGVEKMESLSRLLIRAGAKRVLKDLKGRQPSYYFMNKSDILRLKEEEEVY